MQFVCDFCQSTVRLKDKKCPTCNAVFSKVRCPNCNFGGEPREFRNGCSACGFTDIFMSGAGKHKDEWTARDKAKATSKYRMTVIVAVLLIVNVLLFLYAGLY